MRYSLHIAVNICINCSFYIYICSFITAKITIKGKKGKAKFLKKRHLTTTKRSTSSAVQPWKCWLIGNGCSTAAQVAAPIARVADY